MIEGASNQGLVSTEKAEIQATTTGNDYIKFPIQKG